MAKKKEIKLKYTRVYIGGRWVRLISHETWCKIRKEEERGNEATENSKTPAVA